MTQKIIKIEDLISKDLRKVISDRADFAAILNTPPKKEWLKQHPLAKNVVYLPIERVEFLLTWIFAQWWVEVKTIQTVANSVLVSVRLWVKDPLNGTDSYQDGIGAAPIQTKAGAGATQWEDVLTDAVMKAAPAAESYAIKDAAEKWGKLFGKDLNRDVQTDYSVLTDRYSTRSKVERLEDQLAEILDTYQDTDGDKIRNIVAETKRAGKLTEEYLKSQIENLRR